MEVAEGEYLFLFNSNRIEDRVARGYAKAIQKVNERDIHKDHLTPRQIARVAEMLDVPISDLYQEKGGSTYEQFRDDELIRVLAYDPSKMKTPIILSKGNSFFVGSSYELIKEKIEINEITNAHANRSES